MNNEDDNIRRELYLLIAKFLSKGPCERAASVLVEELAKHRLLGRRLDWTGQEHDQTYEETCARIRHIPDDFLLRISQRLGPLVEQCVPGSASGFRSLLGAGRQSLLRTSSGNFQKQRRATRSVLCWVNTFVISTDCHLPGVVLSSERV